MQTQYDSSVPSYVNMGSSILRNKFEKNRTINTKKQLDNIIELSNDDKFNMLNNRFVEYDVKINNLLTESKNNDGKLTTFESSMSDIKCEFNKFN
jgi:hypothetical protein